MSKIVPKDETGVNQSLSSKLRAVRSRFLHDVEIGDSRQWIVVMGNESGDLDTVASSLAFWWFRYNVLNNDKIVPLIQTPRAEMKLRPENEYALSLASLDAAHEDLLCIDDIHYSKTFPADKFVLVDHNRLLAKFSDNSPEASVVAIVDHHEDEQLHLKADPRIVRTPVGSASSLTTEYIISNLPSGTTIPPELSSLLLSAILIDTGGLKPGGKAEGVDRTSAASLFPMSTFAQSGDFVSSETDASSLQSRSETLHEHPALQSIFGDLITRKNDVMHLGVSELLKRDYKQYQWKFGKLGASSAGGEVRTVNVGLSTVPLGLHSWLPNSGASEFFDIALAYMSVHGLDILGILTSFHDDDKGKEKGEHKRQLMLIFRSPQEEASQTPELVEYVLSSLLTIDSAKVLELEEVKVLKYFDEGDAPTNWASGKSKGGFLAKDGIRMDAHLFKQKNAKATRKIIAPLLKEIIEGSGES